MMMMMMMIVRWILYAAGRLDEAMETLTKQWLFGIKKNQEDIDKAKAVTDLCFDRLEHVLKDRQYILGSE